MAGPRRRVAAAAVVLAALAALAVLAGCGRKAPPQPPVLRLAEQTRDLKAVQEGTTVVLRFTPPGRTTDGGPLPDLEEVEVWRAQIPEGREPQGSSERDRQVKMQLLEARGERLRVLAAADVAGAVEGGLVVVRDDVESLAAGASEEEPAVLWYAVRTRCCRGRLSAFSNIVRVTPTAPPEAPADLVLAAGADGISVHWPEGQTSVLVERSAAGEETWETLTDQPVRGTSYLDVSATQGQSWSYRLRAAKVLDGGQRVVGAPGPESTVSHPDVYPPQAPAELVCLPEGEVVRLRWPAVDEATSYQIERSRDGGSWEQLVQRREGLTYEDQSPPVGGLVYGVRAVDAAGNASEAATCSVVTGRSG
jgi:hypothetical protein